MTKNFLGQFFLFSSQRANIQGGEKGKGSLLMPLGQHRIFRKVISNPELVVLYNLEERKEKGKWAIEGLFGNGRRGL